MSWKKEKVVSASYWTRPKRIPGLTEHHGVVVYTENGKKYLIHNTLDCGPVVTDKTMSMKWTKHHDITVVCDKTVAQVLREASIGGQNKTWNYLSSGTCIGTATLAERALQDRQCCCNIS